MNAAIRAGSSSAIKWPALIASYVKSGAHAPQIRVASNPSRVPQSWGGAATGMVSRRCGISAMILPRFGWPKTVFRPCEGTAGWLKGVGSRGSASVVAGPAGGPGAQSCVFFTRLGACLTQLERHPRERDVQCRDCRPFNLRCLWQYGCRRAVTIFLQGECHVEDLEVHSHAPSCRYSGPQGDNRLTKAASRQVRMSRKCFPTTAQDRGGLAAAPVRQRFVRRGRISR